MLAVITVIEALRAFDIVYIINNGRNGLELLSVLVTDNIIGEASRVGYGSAIAVILLTISIVPITIFVVNASVRGSMTSATVEASATAEASPQRGRARRSSGLRASCCTSF